MGKRNTIEIVRIMLIFMVFFIFTITQSLNANVHSKTSAHTSYSGISMTGYQGWFGTPDDGLTNEWRHYNNSQGFKPGAASIEYWPDMREADEDEKCKTKFFFEDGSPAYVFSPVNPKTVNRHFKWMKEYGIDGAFMQRFRSDFSLKPVMNKILGNALDAANEHNRAIGLMYDLTGLNIKVNGVVSETKRAEEVENIFNDWKNLINTLGLTTGGDDQAYLYHNGKPLIVLWGLGFKSRHGEKGYDVQLWIDLVDKFQNDPDYGGCSVMLGIATYWRFADRDCISGIEYKKMMDLIKKVDIIKPWHTSRFTRDKMSTDFKKLITDDIAWCNANGIGYTPTISPGIREKILRGRGYELSREDGYYFWDMSKTAIEAGVKMLYLGMFDEIDEGTQYYKINNNPPFYSDQLSFGTYGSNPEDHYLWLAGEATRAVRGEFEMGTTFRKRANRSDFKSELKITDTGTGYKMELLSKKAGRKIYYADPYKVPDGAPTVGTIRDESIYKNELTSEIKIFEEDQGGLYIRFVEVNSETDEIISFRSENLITN